MLNNLTFSTEKFSVKKAFKSKSKLLHPDRAADTDQNVATEKFKVMSEAHNILSDPLQRAKYNETGAVSNLNYIITDDQMNECVTEYKGSAREEEDIRDAYMHGHGDIKFILKNVPFATAMDDSRISDVVKELVRRKVVPDVADMETKKPDQKPYQKRKKTCLEPEPEPKRAKRQLAMDANVKSIQN